LAISACGGTQRVVESIPTPAERLICEQAGTRPQLPPEHAIDWSQIRTVDAAKIAHENFVSVLRTRENIVAGYVLKLEGVNFVCFNNMQWRRDFEAGLPQPETPDDR
jgi:hypothetical protein